MKDEEGHRKGRNERTIAEEDVLVKQEYSWWHGTFGKTDKSLENLNSFGPLVFRWLAQKAQRFRHNKQIWRIVVLNKFDLEIGQRSRSWHGVNGRGLSQGSCMPNINALSLILQNIVAAFRGMHLSPAKHSYAWLPRKCDYRTDRWTDRQTDGQTDAWQSDLYGCNTQFRIKSKGYFLKLKIVWWGFPLFTCIKDWNSTNF